MKNYVQPGNMLDLTAPSGGVTSGQGILIGALFGVAATAAAEGDKVAVSVEGVYELPKVTGSSLSEGAAAYWTPGGKVSGTASGNTAIGHVTEAAGAEATLVRVRISN